MTTRQSGGPASIPRTITLGAAPFITMAAMIDAGVFATLGPATEKAGSGITLSIVLAGLLALASGTSGAQLGSAFPISGGAFIWTRKVGLARMLSFAAGCWFLAKEVISQSVNALILMTYSKAVIPGLPIHIIAAAVVVAMTILNYFGVQPTAKVLVALTLFLVALLAGYFGFAARDFLGDRLFPIFGRGPGGVLGGAGTFFLTFAGFQRVAVIASEVKRPKRTVPLGIYIGFSVSAVLFLLAGCVTLGVLGAPRMGTDPMPLLTAAQQTAGHRGTWIVVAAAILATVTTLAGGILGASRVAQSMGWEREFPKWMASGEGEMRTPRHAVLTLGLGTAAVTLFFNLRPLIDIANVFTLLWYSATNYAAVRLSDEQRFASRAVSWFGAVGCIVLLFTFPWWAILLAVGATALVTLGRGVTRRRAAS